MNNSAGFARVQVTEFGPVEPSVGAGMSLRDYFAGQALNAIIEDVNRPRTDEAEASEHPRVGIARRAYAIADAMIATREQVTEEPAQDAGFKG